MNNVRQATRKMVWCLEFPAQFGRFFPHGGYVGWEEALERYYMQELSEADRQTYDNRYAKYASIAAQKFSSTTDPILDHEWPQEYHLDRDYKRLGSISNSQNGIMWVESALKDLIEALEPGVHHFRPLRLLTRTGEVYPGDYHVMAIGQNLNGFDPEGSDPDCIKWSERSQKFNVYTSDLKGMAFNSGVVFGKHIWREKGVTVPYICLSDALVQEIRARDFLMPELIATKGCVA